MNRITSTAIGAALLQILSAQPAVADADIDRYVDSGYSYCDAVILGAFWGESVDDAKSTIGRKIGWGNFDIVADNIAVARESGERCEFSDTGFTFEDAEALAQLWDVGLVEAKTALIDKVSLGDQSLADDAVSDALAAQRRQRAAQRRQR